MNTKGNFDSAILSLFLCKTTLQIQKIYEKFWFHYFQIQTKLVPEVSVKQVVLILRFIFQCKTQWNFQMNIFKNFDLFLNFKILVCLSHLKCKLNRFISDKMLQEDFESQKRRLFTNEIYTHLHWNCESLSNQKGL